MASLPTFDPNKLASHDFASVKTDYDRLQADPSQPLLNRAIQLSLPPGSTFKLVTASAAIESGKYNYDSEVPGGTTYQLPQTTGSSGEIDNEGRDCGTDKIPFSQAMENSCNTTFAQLGVELGARRAAGPVGGVRLQRPLPRRHRPADDLEVPRRRQRARRPASPRSASTKCGPRRCRWRWSRPGSPTRAW